MRPSGALALFVAVLVLDAACSEPPPAGGAPSAGGGGAAGDGAAGSGAASGGAGGPSAGAGGASGAAGATVSATFTPSEAPLANPERGWYGWASDDFGASLEVDTVDAAFAKGYRLMFAKVELGAFRSSPISATFLSELSARLATLRAHGMKAVLRFAYDYTEGGNDAPATQIESHVEQLAPVLTENADALAVFQAGFIGAWGEWHSSKHSNSYGYHTNPGVTLAEANQNRLIVRDALLAATPASVPLVFRDPGDLLRWYPDPTTPSRVGLHNDCFLAGPTDTGTYESQAERSYVMSLTERNSFGGETCDADTPLRTSCDDIRREGASYHLAYLNREYFEGFFTAWQAGGCLDEVERRMGYRLELDAVRHATRATPGSTLRVEVELRNVGWASVTGERKLVVRLVRDGNVTTAASTTRLSALEAQATKSTTIPIDIVLPTTEGDYAVELAAPDVHPRTMSDARFAIRFANADAGAQAWRPASASFATGTIVSVRAGD